MNQSTADPVYVHSKNEAYLILIVWALSFAWTVPYCYSNGFQTTNENWELSLTMGMPSWIFWGVGLPWFVAGILSILICLFFIKDDDLGQAKDELPLNEE
ncbi:hypothetical protein OAF42_00415 [Planctomicrobium sp.]|nr:hypothetical protein [Planctomicrobium sp.]MDA7504203.1 hypothetical protein [bacterium]MDB4732881.1 hypothetical protein [Planctomicrobium sp.]